MNKEDQFDQLLNWTRNLRASEIRVLAAIILRGGGRCWVEYPQDELCEWTALKAASVSKAVHKLTQLDILERRHSNAEDFSTGRSVNSYRVEWNA